MKAEELPISGGAHINPSSTVEPGSTDCRLLIDAKRSLENVLKTLSAVHNQLEGMHDLKRAGGAGVSFRSSSSCSKTIDVLAG